MEAPPQKFKLGKHSAEHPSGTIQRWIGYAHCLLKCLEKVRSDWILTSLTYNLKRVLHLVGNRNGQKQGIKGGTRSVPRAGSTTDRFGGSARPLSPRYSPESILWPSGSNHGSTSRIQALWTQSFTLFPLPFLRSWLTPKERNSLMISRCALTAAAAPVPPRPVFCTAR
jgi:hypothetical protein